MQKNNLINIIKYVFGTFTIKIILFIVFVLSLYGAYLSSKLSYIYRLIYLLTYPQFYVPAVLIVMLISSFIVFSHFDTYENIILRYKSKKEYVNKLMRTVFIANTYLYASIIIVLMISLNLFSNIKDIVFEYNNQINTYNFIYMIFVIIRLYFIAQFISLTSVITLKLVDYKITLIINVLLHSWLIIGTVYSTNPISNLTKMPLLINYYLSVVDYNSFALELLITTIYITILYIVYKIIVLFLIRNIKGLGNI